MRQNASPIFEVLTDVPKLLQCQLRSNVSVTAIDVLTAFLYHSTKTAEQALAVPFIYHASQSQNTQSCDIKPSRNGEKPQASVRAISVLTLDLR